MRIDAHTDDSSVVEEVRLNGRRIERVMRADEELGLIIAYAIGDDGKPILEGEEFRTYEKRGNVEIVLKKEFAWMRMMR